LLLYLTLVMSYCAQFINLTLPYLCMLHEYHVILVYSVRYYPRVHKTAIGLGKHYPWIRWHYCILAID
jgi:hypothetical protein